MGRLMNLYINRMVDYLAGEGKRIAQDALNSKEPQNRSENMADAYGYAVFYNGEIKKKGYAREAPQSKGTHKGWDKIGVDEGTGREWLDDFFTEWKPEGRGFDLIVVNAAFYSGILEQGRQNEYGRRFEVITQIAGEMKDLQAKFKGSTLIGKNIYIN